MTSDRKWRLLAPMLGALGAIVLWLVGAPVALVGAQAATASIWANSAAPTNASNSDANSVEVGVKFRSDTSGYIVGVRFYKGSANTGTHVGNLWSSGGTLLATATFTGETASGWQQVNLATPVAITANTTYVASYFAPSGHYAADQNYFASNVDNAPLHALSSSSSGGNGVYAYSSSSTFPTSTYTATNYWVDVVFSTSLTPTNTPTRTPTPTATNTPAPVNCPCSVWTSAVHPGGTNTGTSPVELGTRLRADRAGYVASIRFYKPSGETGTHVVNLWSNTGTLLGTAQSSGESASGWQQVNFATPLAISANTTYVASYHSNGTFGYDLNAFTNAGVDTPPLHVLQNGVDGPNGVYLYGATSAFPTNTYQASNYGVDVVFNTTAQIPTNTPSPTPTSTPTAGPPTSTPTNTPTSTPANCPCTIWPTSAAPTNASSSDTNSVELGVKFRSDINGYVTGVRFYKGGATNSATHVGNLWNSSGSLLASATFSGETTSGWQQVNFGSAIPITANTTYVASYFAPAGHYAADQNYFASNVDNAPLHALSSAGSGGNGVYAYGSSSTFPSNTYNATSYWVDVVFSTTSSLPTATPTAPTTISGVTVTNLSTTSTTINWTTNNAATSQVRYGTTSSYTNSTTLDSAMVTAHSQGITGLTPATTYHYSVQSRDSSNTLVSSQDATFITLAVGSTGSWSPVMNWPLVGVHSTLLNTGKVLTWDAWETGGTPSATLWDPATQTFSGVPDTFSQIFCAGQVQMADGRIMVVGGHNGGERGIDAATIFNPATGTWSAGAPMSFPRWYPMVTALPDGRVLTLGGNTTPGFFAETPEVYDPLANTWSTIAVSTPDADEENYPLGFVLPNGRVFVIEPDQGTTRILDVNAPSWTTAVSATSPVIFGSAIQYRPGKFLYTGGSHATNSETTAAVVDMTQANPTWQTIAPMSFARTFHNMVSLPDGNVLVIGGGGTRQQGNTTPGPLQPELWNPNTMSWTTLAPMTNPRMYHSTALLLPDATVLVAGGGRLSPAVDYSNAQIFSPPYLALGARPTITSAPATATIGTSIGIQTPNAASIGSVSLVSLGADTHNYDMSQRFVPLTFTAGSGNLTVQMPNSVNLAPPGNYMLFLVSTTGVPSVASIVNVQAATPSTLPTITGVTPSTVAGYGVTVSWTTDRIATSQVEYGTSTGYGSFGPLDSIHTTNHSAQLLNLTPNTLYHYRVHSTDTFGNQAISGDFSVTTSGPPTCPCTIWPTSAAPSGGVLNDGQSIEVGVKFYAEHDGFIRGIRFYKSSGNSGTHTGYLWTLNGTQLASAVFTGETSSGWQQVNFGSAVAITGGTTYVASYLSASGNYSADVDAFASAGVARSPLDVPSNAVARGNGVYAYTSSGTYPNQLFGAANYWVDVVYTLTSTGANVPLAMAPESASSAPDVAAPAGSGAIPWSSGVPKPATDGAAKRLLELGLVKPHSAEHSVSYWCPLATTSPAVAAAPPAVQPPPMAAIQSVDPPPVASAPEAADLSPWLLSVVVLLLAWALRMRPATRSWPRAMSVS